MKKRIFVGLLIVLGFLVDVGTVVAHRPHDAIYIT